ncbi:MAG: selenocysteine lyase/cysteine desulfurase [Limisphaerales bacterium]|jgi:selenocysteine lyase/cysteine desulfurase
MNNPFHIPSEITYLNCAYMAPLTDKALQLGQEGLAKKTRPWLFTGEDFFEPIKKVQNLFAKIIHSDQPDRVALIPSASYGMANVVRNIKLEKGQKIILVAAQFPSNVYSWQRIAEESGSKIQLVDAPASANGKGRTAAWNEAILAAIDEETAAVSMPHVHWADGTLFDLVAIRAKTLKHGAYLTIDGTQSVGAHPFDVNKIQPDALVCAGYKWLLGPYSTGLAWYGPRFDNGTPIEENWIHRKDSDQFANLVNYQAEYRTGAARYSVGELSNFALLPALTEALDTVLNIGVDNIAIHTRKIAAQSIAHLEEMGCDVGQDVPHLFGIRPGANFEIEKIKTALTEAKIFVSYRGDAIRVSPHIYNSKADLEKLTNAIASVRQSVLS